MRKVTNLVLAMAMAASVVGAASADRVKRTNYQQFPGSWYYPWCSPSWGQGGFQEAGAPFKGTHFSKDFAGEVVYIDTQRLQIKADGSGDILNFFLYAGETRFTPSTDGIRQGSKVKVRSDDRRRARSVEVVPFYKWLKGRTK